MSRSYITSSPKLEGLLVLRINELKYGIAKLVSFLVDDALEESRSIDEAFAPTIPHAKAGSFHAGSSAMKSMFDKSSLTVFASSSLKFTQSRMFPLHYWCYMRP